MIGLAAVAAGLTIAWAILAPPDDAVALGTGAAGVAATLVILHRLGLLADGDVPARARFQLWLAATGARAGGALRVLAATVRTRPSARAGLVRVRMRAAAPAAHVAFALAASATPGWVAVDIDDEALLLHALDEEAVDVAALVALETRAQAALGEGRA